MVHHVPSVEGWALIKTASISNEGDLKSDEEKSSVDIQFWEPRWLALDSGSILWYLSEIENEPEGIGSINEKSVSTSKDKSLPSGEQIINFKVKSTKGLVNVEVALPKENAGIWYNALDAHSTVPIPSQAPVYNKGDQGPEPKSHLSPIVINGNEYSLPISLQQEAEEILHAFLDNNSIRLPAEERANLLVEILKLQLSISTGRLAGYEKLKYTYARRQIAMSVMEERIGAAEKHSAELDSSLQTLDILLPKVISAYQQEHSAKTRCENSLREVESQAKYNREVNAALLLEIEDLKTQMDEVLLSPVSPESHPEHVWRSRCKKLKEEKLAAAERATQYEAELTLHKTDRNTDVMQVNLRAENATLRQQTIQCREEIIKLQAQIHDIEESAVEAVIALKEQTRDKKSKQPGVWHRNTPTSDVEYETGGEEEEEGREYLAGLDDGGGNRGVEDYEDDIEYDEYDEVRRSTEQKFHDILQKYSRDSHEDDGRQRGGDIRDAMLSNLTLSDTQNHLNPPFRDENHDAGQADNTDNCSIFTGSVGDEYSALKSTTSPSMTASTDGYSGKDRPPAPEPRSSVKGTYDSSDRDREKNRSGDRDGDRDRYRDKNRRDDAHAQSGQMWNYSDQSHDKSYPHSMDRHSVHTKSTTPYVVHEGDYRSPGSQIRTADYSLDSCITVIFSSEVAEERFIQFVFGCYVSVTTTNLLSLTRFLRFARDFGITREIQASGSGVGGGDKDHGLVYGEVSMVFTNTAKSTIPESPSQKKNTSGKRAPTYAHVSPCSPFYTPPDKSRGDPAPFIYASPNDVSARAAAAAEKNIVGTQFKQALEQLAVRLYAKMIERKMETVYECLPVKQQAAVRRTAFELLLKSVLIPTAVSLGIMPWAMIHVNNATASLNSLVTSPTRLDSHMKMGTNMLHQKILLSPIDHHLQLIGCAFLHYADRSDRRSQSRKSKPINESNTRESSERMSYHATFSFVHDFRIVPFLIKEQDLHGLFKEVHALQEERGRREEELLLDKDPSGGSASLQLSVSAKEALLRYSGGTNPDGSTVPHVQMNKPFSYVHPRNSGKISSSLMEMNMDHVSFAILVSALAMQVFSSLPMDRRVMAIFEYFDEHCCPQIYAFIGTRDAGEHL